MSCSFFYPCRVFCRVLVIFSCRVKFVFVSCSCRVAVSCPELPGLFMYVDAILGPNICFLEQVEMCVDIFMHYVF